MFKELFKRNKASFVTYDYFFLRRYTMVGLLFFAYEFGLSQICVMFICTFIILNHISQHRPYNTVMQNREALLHEIACFIFFYFLLCYTDAVPNPRDRYTIGWIPIVFLMIYGIASIFLVEYQ